jgi:hypothetical protein
LILKKICPPLLKPVTIFDEIANFSVFVLRRRIWRIKPESYTSEVNQGTRDQRFLSLRLAYLEVYAMKVEAVPYIGDDLLTTWDDK